MDRSEIRAFGAAHRYYQGPGAVALIGDCVAELGRHPVLVCDVIVRDLVHAGVVASCASQSLTLRWLEVRGDVTHVAVQALCAAARAEGATPDVVIAAGGGKGVDTGKAVARELGARLVVLPTSASNDGPCSKAFVYYDDHHRLLSVEQLARNPDAVVVDTRFLVRAPRMLLVSGIGDALCKLYEGDQTRLAHGRNLFGGVSTIAAQQLSVACDRVIRADAQAALESLQTGEPNAAFERLTEALVLLSGLAFENSGLSIAHSMTRGLPRVPELGAALHGLQVAYGLYVQWQLEGRSAAFMAEQARFFRAIGLPCTLAELGAKHVDAAMIASIAEGTMQSPHLKHFQRPLAQADFVAAMHGVEALSFSSTRVDAL